MKPFLITIFILFIFICQAQKSNKLFIHTDNCNHFIAGINNYFSIFDKNNSNIKKENISVLFYSKNKKIKDSDATPLEIIEEYGKFRINPKSYGYVEITVSLKDTSLTKLVNIKPIEIECSLGGKYKAGKIKAFSFKTQSGILVFVNCCGFDARCNVINFEIIRAPQNGKREKSFNKDFGFNSESKALVQKAKAGDIYIIKSIYYNCLQNEKQEAPDMIFEIE